MAELFDDISRIVGSNMPRRRALNLIMGAVAGSGVAALWPTRTGAVNAQNLACDQEFQKTAHGWISVNNCVGLREAGGAPWLDKKRAACAEGRRLARIAAAGVICPPNCDNLIGISYTCFNYSCGGNTLVQCDCTVKYKCCSSPCGRRCCSSNEICCDQTCCPSNRVCCEGICCALNAACCNGQCCSPGQVCCGWVCCVPENCNNDRCNNPH